MVSINDIREAFGNTPLPGVSYPFPVYGILPTALKTVEINAKQGLITAYLTVYHNDDGTPFVDPYMDIVSPGAFSKTIKELDAARNKKHNPWLCIDLWQHDHNNPIGGIRGLTEDAKGVVYEAQLAMGVQKAREALELAEMKALGSSYGYDPFRFAMLPGNIRDLKEVKLREISQVSFPANDLAPILDTKQRWAWSHVPEQAERALGKKAQDFSQAWAAKQPDTLMRQYWQMLDILGDTLLSNLKDAEVTDKIAAIDMLTSQYAKEVGSWVPLYESAQANMPDDGGGMDLEDLLDMMFMSERLDSLVKRISSLKELPDAISEKLTSVQAEIKKVLETVTQESTSQAPSDATPPDVTPLFIPAPTTPPVLVSSATFLQEVQQMFRSRTDALNTTRVS